MSFARHEVTHTAWCTDRIRPELAPQRMYVHLHRIALDGIVPSIQPIFELCTRQYGARTLHQRLEHRELARRQLHWGAPNGHVVRRGIEPDAVVLDGWLATSRC